MKTKPRLVSSAIAVIPIEKSSTPATMILQAVKQGTDLKQVKELLDLQERWESNEAKKAYHVAMTAFKANAPKIDRDRAVAFGNTKFKHATLWNVVDKISLELTKHGLSLSWRVQQNGTICVTTKITHIQGHSEETTLSAPADGSGSKNAIQAIGSTISYLERYGALAMTGLATFDQDDDGNSVVELIDDKQKNQLTDLILAGSVNEGAFLSYMKVESLDRIPKKEYQKAFAALEAKVKK